MIGLPIGMALQRATFREKSVTTELGIGKTRDYLELISDSLELGMKSRTKKISTGELKWILGSHHILTRTVNTMNSESFGLIRRATHEELVEMAKFEMAQQSHIMSYKEYHNYKPKPTISMINRYIRKHLKHVYVLTEKGQKVAVLLKRMERLLLSDSETV